MSKIKATKTDTGLEDFHKKNFETLTRAFDEKNICLLDCTDKKTGKKVAVICAVQKEKNEYVFVPFAKMFNSNPYEEVIPPPMS